ncbi:MAG: hypothetical protein IT445_19670, partial [Phycisphaeraceae bacterium]|nr:hypothetical protein [Phycisphaeraceae bacterium]
MASQRPLIRKLLKIVGCVIAVFAVVLIIATVWINLCGSAAQRAVLAELQQRDLWPMPAVSMGDPAINLLHQTAAALQPDDALAERMPLFGMHDPSFGAAIDTATAAALTEYVQAHRDALDQLDRAIADDRIRLPTERLKDNETDVLSDLRLAVKALSACSLYEQAHGRPDEAVERLLHIAQLRQVTNGGALVRFYVNVSIDWLYYEDIHDLFSRCELSADAIERLLASLQTGDMRAELIAAKRGEVGDAAERLVSLDEYFPQYTHDLVQAFEHIHQWEQSGLFPLNGDMRGFDPLLGVLPESVRRSTLGNLKLDMWLTRWGYRIWPGRWRSIQAAVVREQLLTYDQWRRSADLWADAATSDDDAVRFGSYNLIASSVVAWALTVEQYRLEHGEWPPQPEAIDLPPELIYKLLDNGVVIYHVGRNAVDDGGVQDGFDFYDDDIALRCSPKTGRVVKVDSSPADGDESWQARGVDFRLSSRPGWRSRR